MTEVATLGEALLAFRFAEPARIGSYAKFTFAGAESNVAVGLARLGHDAAWVGAVGGDVLAEQILRGLRGEGVDCSQVRVDSERSTAAIVFDAPTADTRRVTYFRQRSAGSHLGDAEIDAIRHMKPGLVHLTGITAALGPELPKFLDRVIAAAREIGATISFDVNFRGTLWTWEKARHPLERLVASADVVFATEDELSLLAGEEGSMDERVARLEHPHVVVRSGTATASVFSGAGKVSGTGVLRRVIDPVGAGDGFAAGYLSAWLDGRPAEERIARAHAVAGFVVMNHGDWEGLPRRADLEMALADDDVYR